MVGVKDGVGVSDGGGIGVGVSVGVYVTVGVSDGVVEGPRVTVGMAVHVGGRTGRGTVGVGEGIAYTVGSGPTRGGKGLIGVAGLLAISTAAIVTVPLRTSITNAIRLYNETGPDDGRRIFPPPVGPCYGSPMKRCTSAPSHKEAFQSSIARLRRRSSVSGGTSRAKSCSNVCTM
jgi:hypothetical protein